MLLRAFTVLILPLVVGLVLAGSARAGSYEVVSCLDAPGLVNNAWESVQPKPAEMITSQACEANLTVDVGPNVERLSGLAAGLAFADTPLLGTQAFWRLSAPAGATISQIRYSRYFGKMDIIDYQPFLRTETGQVLEGACPVWGDGGPDFWCERGWAGYTGTPSAAGFSHVTWSVPAASRLEFGVGCYPPQIGCVGSRGLHLVWAMLLGSTVTITESAPPSIVMDSGVGAWSETGWLSGTQSVRVASATDTVGIKRLRVLIDGDEVARSDRSCDYTRVVPCPAVSGQTLSFSTAGSAEGQRTLTVQATDAANNTSTTTKQVLIDSAAPVAPQLTAAANSVTVGRPWSLSVQATGGQGTPVAALRYRICTGETICGVAQTITATDEITGTFTQPGLYTVRVWARDQAGNEDETNAARATIAAQHPQPLSTGPVIEPPSSVTRLPTSVPVAQRPAASQDSSDRAQRERFALKITNITAKGRTLTLRVRSDYALLLRLRVTAKGRTQHRTVTVDQGATTLRVRLPRTLPARARVTARIAYPGDDDLHATTSTRSTRSR